MLEVKNLTKIYKTKKADDVRALDDVSISFNKTGLVFLLGKSGSGKSTLLNVMGGLDKFDSGEIIIKGKSSKSFKERDFDSYRNTFLGFIFQEYNVLPEFTVQKNIALALELQGKKADKESVNDLLEQVDLKGYAKRKPNQLSGGQKQRIAIARALIKNPEIIMADEPTGALDSNTGKQVFDTLKKLSETKLVIVVSHDREFAEIYGDRIIEMRDGKIISDTTKRKRAPKAISSGFKVVGDHILHIEKNHQFTSLEAKYLSDLVRSSGSDVVISANANINKDIKKLAKIDEQGNSEFFDVTNTNDIDPPITQNDLKLIKSRLKYKDSFKMGASGLKTKKIRLAITILLSAISLALFGLSDTMASFNLAKSNYESLKNLDLDYISIGKTYVTQYDDNYYDREDGLLTESDFENLKARFSDYTFTPKKQINYDLYRLVHEYNYNNYYYQISNVRGAFEFDDLDYSKAGLKLYPNSNTGKFPTSSDEVAITKLQYDFIVEYGLDSDSGAKQIVTSVTQVLDQIVNINGQNYKICGVIDTGFDEERYASLKNNSDDFSSYMKMVEFGTYINYGLHNAFYFTKGGLSQGISVTVPSHVYFDWSESTGREYRYFSTNGADILSKYAVTFSPNKTALSNNEVIVGCSCYDEFYYSLYPDEVYFGESSYSSIAELKTAFTNQVRSLSSTLNKKITIYDYWDPDNTKEYTVVGVYFDILRYDSIQDAYDEYYSGYDKNEAAYLKNESAVPTFMEKDFGSYVSILTKFLNNKNSDMALVKYLSGYNSKTTTLVIKSQVSDVLENFVGIIEVLAKVFLYVGIGFAAFSALLLMNFIAISISYKKKEIGILRALGARGSDVYGIFFNESLIITFFNFLLSAALTLGTTIFINLYMRNDLGFYVKLLSFGLRQLVLLAVVSFVVAVVASFLPTHRISKMKPIDAIQDRK